VLKGLATFMFSASKAGYESRYKHMCLVFELGHVLGRETKINSFLYLSYLETIYASI